MPPSNDKVENVYHIFGIPTGAPSCRLISSYVKRMSEVWNLSTFELQSFQPSRIVGAPCCRNWSILSFSDPSWRNFWEGVRENLHLISSPPPPQSLTVRSLKSYLNTWPPRSKVWNFLSDFLFRNNVELRGWKIGFLPDDTGDAMIFSFEFRQNFTRDDGNTCRNSIRNC